MSVASAARRSFLLPRRYRISRLERIADALIHGAVEATPGRHLIASDELA